LNPKRQVSCRRKQGCRDRNAIEKKLFQKPVK